MKLRIAMRQAMHGERDVNLLEIASLDLGASDEARGLRRRRSRPSKACEPPFDFRHHGSMLDRARRHDDHIGTAVVAAKIVRKPGTIERSHGRRGAEDRPANRLTSEGGLLQLVPDEIIRGIFSRANLL